MADVKKYYLEDDFNCAEAVLLAANDRWDLGLTAEDIKLVGGFGGGMACGKTCGAICGAVAAFGKIAVKTERSKETEGFRDRCAAMVAAFEKELSGTDCAELKPLYNDEETRCLKVVTTAMKVLGEA